MDDATPDLPATTETTATGSPGGETAGASSRPETPAATPLARRVFALADTHLGGNTGRTMDKFGPWWKGHEKKIFLNAWRLVRPDDLFLLPGDLSWAKKRRQAEDDLAFLASLPGIKVAIKGNHDFWWESEKPINYPGLHSPPFLLDGGAIGVAGTRGWDAPVRGSQDEKTDRAFFEREQGRLQKSLDAIADCRVKIAMLHYPPQPFLPQLKAAGVAVAVYGHVHVNSLPKDEVLALDGESVDGIPLYCVACDRIGFSPRLIEWDTAPRPADP
jgi:uncharacterized protein